MDDPTLPSAPEPQQTPDAVPSPPPEPAAPEPEKPMFDRWLDENPDYRTEVEKRVNQAAHGARKEGEQYRDQFTQLQSMVYALQSENETLRQQSAAPQQEESAKQPDAWDAYRNARSMGDVDAEVKALQGVVGEQVQEGAQNVVLQSQQALTNQLVTEHEAGAQELQWYMENAGIKDRVAKYAASSSGDLDKSHPLSRAIANAYNSGTVSNNGMLNRQNWREIGTQIKSLVDQYEVQRNQTANQSSAQGFMSQVGQSSNRAPAPSTKGSGQFRNNPETGQMEFIGDTPPDAGTLAGFDSNQKKAVQRAWDEILGT